MSNTTEKRVADGTLEAIQTIREDGENYESVKVLVGGFYLGQCFVYKHNDGKVVVSWSIHPDMRSQHQPRTRDVAIFTEKNMKRKLVHRKSTEGEPFHTWDWNDEDIEDEEIEPEYVTSPDKLLSEQLEEQEGGYCDLDEEDREIHDPYSEYRERQGSEHYDRHPY